MKIQLAFILASAVLCAACSPAGSSKIGGGPDGGAAVPGTVAPGTQCTPGTDSCYCPDGTPSGSQTCDAQHVLSSCNCPQSLGNVGTVPTAVPGDTTNLCPELQGKSGCTATSYVSQQVPSSILFVVDRSGSMACNPPPVQDVAACNSDPKRADPSQPSKWEITTKALNAGFAALSGTSGSIGLSLFSTDGVCGVDSTPAVPLAAPSAVQLSTLAGAMAGSGPAGGTPIVGAVVLAYRHLHQELHATGNRYVVLITDGEESCGTKGDETDKADLQAARDQLLNTEVKKARDANIRTFVIGAPGSEGARSFLSELAFQGGTARTPTCAHGVDNGDCHFDLTTQADFAAVLSQTLGQISGRALGCEFATPPGGSGLVNVQTSKNGGAPACLQQSSGPCESGASGWQFAKDAAGNDDLSRVVLCGAACDAAKADPTTKVDVVLGCQSLR